MHNLEEHLTRHNLFSRLLMQRGYNPHSITWVIFLEGYLANPLSIHNSNDSFMLISFRMFTRNEAIVIILKEQSKNLWVTYLETYMPEFTSLPTLFFLTPPLPQFFFLSMLIILFLKLDWKPFWRGALFFYLPCKTASILLGAVKYSINSSSKRINCSWIISVIYFHRHAFLQSTAVGMSHFLLLKSSGYLANDMKMPLLYYRMVEKGNVFHLGKNRKSPTKNGQWFNNRK